MMLRAQEALGGLLDRDRTLIDRVDSLEREVCDALRNAQPTDHADFFLMRVRVNDATVGASPVPWVPELLVEIRVPPLGQSVVEATVGRWSRQEGDAVRKDEVLVEIETDKITVEVAAPADGTLSAIRKHEGDTVGVNELLAEMEAGPAASFATANATAVKEELALRLRGAGWDEAEVDLTEGVVTVKRFRRRVFVTANGFSSEISAPVYANESYEQSVSRIIAEGVRVAHYGGSEPGLLCFSAAAIQSVRIPSFHTVN
jgi:hypothetical protein